MGMENKKNILVFGGILLIVLIAAFVFLNQTKQSKNLPEKEIINSEMVIPTVDNSVKVDLQPLIGKKEVLLKIDNIPSGTKTTDYELSYQTKEQGLQGIIGTISLEEDEKNYEKKLTLGTCSSGRCIYHNVTGKIKLNLKFSGDYGEKIFEKEYKI